MLTVVRDRFFGGNRSTYGFGPSGEALLVRRFDGPARSRAFWTRDRL